MFQKFGSVVKNCASKSGRQSIMMQGPHERFLCTMAKSATTAGTTSKPFSGKPLSAVTPCNRLSREGILTQIWDQKSKLNLSIDDIASELGYTNVYTCQILLMNSPLNTEKALKLQNLLQLSEDSLLELTRSPDRRFDTSIMQEPNTYRMIEAIQHNGEALKILTNEKFGDGIMSAIDFYISMDKVIGPNNEERVEIKFNGKFLPFIEQNTNDLKKCKSVSSPNSDAKKTLSHQNCVYHEICDK